MAHHQNMDYEKEIMQLARMAKAMGHPARIVILNYLNSLKSCYFGDIDKELSISKATVSQHLAELKDAGLIQGSIEPPKVRYCIDPDNWKIAKELFSGFFKNPKNIKCK